jgi:hypothetical protein
MGSDDMDWGKIIEISGLVAWSMNLAAPNIHWFWRIFAGIMVIFFGVSIYLGK